MPLLQDSTALERRRWTALGAIAVLFLASRLFGLTLLPVFIDESMHLARAANLNQASLTRSLEDGKLLHILLTSLVVPHAGNALAASRAMAVAAGACGLLAAWGLGRRLLDEATGLAAAGLYVVCPFALFYDRLDLADVYVSSAAALALLAALHAIARPRALSSVGLGLALAAAILAKVTGLVVLALPLVALALARPRPSGAVRAVAWGLGLCGLLVAFPVVYFLRFSTQIEAKAGAVAHPLELVAENTGLAASWLMDYWTAPLLAVGVLVAVVALGRRRRGEALLVAAASLPTLGFVALASSWFPRYILLTTVPFLVLVASGLVRAWRWLVPPGSGALRVAPAALGLALCLAPALAFDYRLLTDPTRAPLPAIEAFQFVNGWPSGYGWADAVRLLEAERARHPEGLSVINDGEGHATGRWAVGTAFVNDPQVEVETMDLDDGETLAYLDRRAAERPVFLLFTRREQAPGTQHFRPRRVAVLHKPNRRQAGLIFRLEPRPGPEKP